MLGSSALQLRNHLQSLLCLRENDWSLHQRYVQVAGQQSGVNVIDKAQSAVNTVKIINALNEISDILKVLLLAPVLHDLAWQSAMCKQIH